LISISKDSVKCVENGQKKVFILGEKRNTKPLHCLMPSWSKEVINGRWEMIMKVHFEYTIMIAHWIKNDIIWCKTGHYFIQWKVNTEEWAELLLTAMMSSFESYWVQKANQTSVNNISFIFLIAKSHIFEDKDKYNHSTY